ncbi:MAG: hypothetical protein ACJAQ0_000264 [Dasania sp.]|jgi:hypothetical protein
MTFDNKRLKITECVIIVTINKTKITNYASNKEVHNIQQ